ncbi:MAG: MerR family transcriptional regulator [Brevibacillus sp.]|nr:MerR family transcriptional regulator [Brevibacillus sp.]
MDQRYYHTGAFAKKAGVTIRTLRYYDKVGLLVPSAHTDTGFRLYTDRDLIRLQQIMALKFLGFPLETIRRLLDGQALSFSESLRVQKEMLLAKQRQLDAVIAAIEYAQMAVQGESAVDWNLAATLIKAMQMEEKDWWKQYYSESAIRKLEERQKNYSEEEQKRDAQRWADLIRDMKQAYAEGKDPASAEVQVLAKRFDELVYEFTQGDPEIEEGLKKLYAHSAFPAPYGKEEGGFIEQALAIYRANKQDS